MAIIPVLFRCKKHVKNIFNEKKSKKSKIIFGD